MSAAYRVIEDGIREELVRAVGRNRYRLWFRDAAVSRVDDGTVTFAVPTEVHRAWLEFTYGGLLQRAAASVLGAGVGVRFEVSADLDLKRAVRDRLPARTQDWEAELGKQRPRPTFDSFVSSDAERFPALLLSQFVHGNGQVDPPAVFLYGERGTGKTHLLEALDAAVRAHTPGEVLYLTARRFTQRYVAALRAREVEAVRAFETDLCHRRLVLLDEVHDLAGRKKTQEELVRLRERALGGRTRFVFAARRHPREIEDLSPRLRSWLMGSVILRLQTPDRVRLEGIVAARARAYALELGEDVRDAILDRTTSVRGAVEITDRWGVASRLLGRALGPEWLDEIAPAVTVTAREEIVRRAKEAVSAHYAVPIRLLEQPTKVRSAALPRRVAMYLVYRAAALPLVELGHAFGLKSHSSVSRAIREIRAERERDPALEHVIDGLLARM